MVVVVGIGVFVVIVIFGIVGVVFYVYCSGVVWFDCVG